KGLSSLETVKRIKEQGGLVSIPHPFDRFRRSVIQSSALNAVLPYADVIEAFNARNTFDSDNRKALGLARGHGMVVSAVSDSHTPGELGYTYVEMPDFDGTPGGFMESLAKGMLVTRRANPLIHIVTTYTKLKRKILPV
ncbi:MAG: PHP domain-containing protein, partial [Chloroflexi bacterium]|nr:PHP domain-containing protein [Chloroflexota bacterium]